MRTFMAPQARRWLFGGVMLVAGLACSDAVKPPEGAGIRAPITISATLTPAQQATVAGMSVEVTGSGITTPIIVALSVSGATVNGTVNVPVGPDRTFMVRAFDAQGRETYNGSATTTVLAGTNAPLTVRMVAVEGSVPIDVTIGTYGVTLTPPTASVAVNGEVTLSASVTSNGGTVGGALTWGVLNPALLTLTVAPDGRSATVRGKIVGSTRVVASYEGVAAASTVTITNPPPANQPPVANANGPYTGTVGTALQFSSSGSSDPDGSIVSYAWTFGDGTTSTLAIPSKSYASAGTFTVTLTVTDNAGATAAQSTTATISAAPPTTGTFAATSVVAGAAHTCALTAAGAVYCWGRGTNGQVGNGANVSSATPVEVSVPSGVTKWTQLAKAGYDYMCAYDGGGSAYCWGRNDQGQLGVGDTQDRNRPTKIMVGLTIESIGGAHACGNYLGARSCWGSNEFGQITGTAGGSFTMPQALPDPSGVSTISMLAGGTFTCLYQTGPIEAVTRRMVNCRGTGAGSSSWTLNAGTTLGNFRAGSNFACASYDFTYCWGDNSVGQFGSFASPITNWIPTALGGAHSCGTLTSNGAVACAGSNSTGQLGDGSSGTTSATPVLVSGGNLTGLTAGASHSCGLRSGFVLLGQQCRGSARRRHDDAAQRADARDGLLGPQPGADREHRERLHGTRGPAGVVERVRHGSGRDDRVVPVVVLRLDHAGHDDDRIGESHLHHRRHVPGLGRRHRQPWRDLGEQDGDRDHQPVTLVRHQPSRYRRALGRLALVALVSACDGRVTAPCVRVDTPVQVSASLSGSAVAWLSVEVTASDIAVPLVVTLDANGTTAHGRVTVPSGPARTFTARGYDAEGTLTHRATTTVDVIPGAGATLPLVLLPVTDAGVGASGDDRVTLDVADITFATGATRRLAATVAHADGTAVSSPSMTWATLDPHVATVSRTGLVSAVAPGTTQVVALSGGGAGVVNVTVQ